MAWEMLIEYTVKDSIATINKFILKRNKSVKFSIDNNSTDDYDTKTKYSVKMNSEKIIEKLELKQKNDNKITVLRINSKIIKIKDSDVIDDVLHASIMISEHAENDNKPKLPYWGSFTTLIDSLQYRHSEKLFRQIEELAENNEVDELVNIVDSLITPLKIFVSQKALFISKKLRECRQAGCDECIRVP